MSADSDRPRVLVCDLDESLVRINTFPSFGPFALRRLLLGRRWRQAATLVWAALGRRSGRLSHAGFKAEVVRAAEALTPGAIRSWSEKVVEEHLNPEVAATVQSWVGLRILSTAAPEIYAREIGTLVGFDHVHGSLPMPNGFYDNVGSAKVSRLSALVELPVELAITDDEAVDAPLIAAARSAQIVVCRRA